jgi:NAD(P) transhydrogenase subunit alpha
MKIGVARERQSGETRVAASPDTVKKLVGLGFAVAVESGAGAAASIPDSAYQAAGATVAPDEKSTIGDADIVFKVRAPSAEETALLKRGAVLIGTFGVLQDTAQAERYAQAGITAFAMELLPRISRAQSMDVLSSQANLAGYKAVLDAASEFGRAFPMMMTAAGTVPPARVVILGAGVAGLQAIATARRLGAVVSAFDVRAAAKEQVESLGAKFVEVEGGADLETKAGYAREMDDEMRARQARAIHETLKKQDIAICTALVPGRKAPVLITDAMLKDMKPGSIIVDLAVEQGGNCEGSEPDKIVAKYGVKIVGWRNVPGRLAEDASAMYARNLLNFLTPFAKAKNGTVEIDWNDEVVKGCLVTRDGQIVHPQLTAVKVAAAQ